MSEVLTMAQMAQELNVSQRVVSAVVNDKADKLRVGAATQERIKLYLEQRGYVQSKSALQVKNGAVQDTVGILFCGEFMHFSHLITALSYFSKAIGQKFGMVEITGITPDKIKKGLREQVAKGVKRLIWIHDNVPEDERQNAEKLFPLLSRMEQVVIYNYRYSQDDIEEEYLRNGIQLVGFDRSASYQKVAETFKNAYNSKIALDEIIFDDSNHGLRGTNSIYKIFKKHGFDIYGLCPPDLYELTDDELAIKLADNLILEHKRNQVDCAFIRNDIMGTAVVNILLKKGIKIPEDISIIGFGDFPLADFQQVPLTTFKHPVKEMCEKTIDLLNEKSSGAGKKYSFKDQFIERQSHKK